MGGIFFDDMEPGAPGAPVRDPEAFARDVGENLVASWEGIARRRAGAAFGERHPHWGCHSLANTPLQGPLERAILWDKKRTKQGKMDHRGS